MVFVDRSKYSNYFSEVTDPKVIDYIRREYKLDEPDLLISKNTKNPTVMGSITKFTACQTVKVATYSLCLSKDVAWFGVENETNVRHVLESANGLHNEKGDELIEKGQFNWRERMFDNFTNADDICFVNLPKSNPEDSLTDLEQAGRSVYVYAGYMKPGKHQIIVYDEPKNEYWIKNIIVDYRHAEVKPKVTYKPHQTSIEFVQCPDG